MNLLRLKHYLILSVLAISSSSCEDNYVSSIPNSPVYLDLNLTTAPYNKLNYSSNQFFYFESREGLPETSSIGYGGMIVNTGFDGSFYAFDMCCPYELKRTIRVYPNDIGQAVCATCGSVFDIANGTGFPSSGVAKEPLKSYKAFRSGNYLYIRRK